MKYQFTVKWVFEITLKMEFITLGQNWVPDFFIEIIHKNINKHFAVNTKILIQKKKVEKERIFLLFCG